MRRAFLAALTLAGGAALPRDAAAQPAGGQPVLAESTLTATISQSLAADSNYDLDPDSPGTSFYGDTRFGLGLLRASETRSLRFLLDTGVRILDQPDESVEFTIASPSVARAAYAQEFANAAFDIDVSARSRRIERDVLDEDFFIDPDVPVPPDDPGALPEDVTRIDDNTFERRLDLDTGFVVGTNAPSSLDFRLTATDVDYSGDSPEDFSPRSAAELAALWRLRLNPVFSAVVFGNYRYEELTEELRRPDPGHPDRRGRARPRRRLTSRRTGSRDARRPATPNRPGTAVEGRSPGHPPEDNSGISLRRPRRLRAPTTSPPSSAPGRYRPGGGGARLRRLPGQSGPGQAQADRKDVRDA